MEETFGNGETEEREMNECGGGIRGGQAAAMAADGCVCLCVWVRRKGKQACRVVSAPEWAVN